MGAQLTGDARTWRRLALAATAATGLLTVRVLSGRRALAEESWHFARDYFAGKLPLADEADLAEPWDQEIVRRLGACEAHLADLEERLGNVKDA
jgi:hypothetical protein